MTWLIIGLVLFLGVHSVSIVSPQGRDALAGRMGEGGYKGAYALVSFVGLALIVWATASRARPRCCSTRRPPACATWRCC